VIEGCCRKPFAGEPILAVAQIRVLRCQEEAPSNQLGDVRALTDLDPPSLRDRQERVQEVRFERCRLTSQRRGDERRIPFAVNEEERRSPDPWQRLAGALDEWSHVDRLRFRGLRLRLRRFGLRLVLLALDEWSHVDRRPRLRLRGLRLWLGRGLRLRGRLWLFQCVMCHSGLLRLTPECA
jgi:hypothetical protein